jgi:hypothetical protein
MSDTEGSDARFDSGSESDGYMDSPQPKKTAAKKAAAPAKAKAAPKVRETLLPSGPG